MTRLRLTPLTRLEGHGEIELILQQDRLVEARVCLTESPRLFESLVTGHRFDEVPDIICRICAICSAVHKLTALSALEQAMNVRIPPAAEKVRELLLLGGQIQSHALHLFMLVLPDFFDEESVVPLLKNKHPLAVAGLSLKAYGNFLQEVMGGRVIHPVRPVFGGVSSLPPVEKLEQLIKETEQWQQKWPGLAAEFLATASYPKASTLCGIPLSVRQQGGVSLSGKFLQYGPSTLLPVAEYADFLSEQKRSYSYAKISGGPNKTFLSGALARQLCLQDASLRDENYEDHGIHANNAAQLFEIGWSFNRILLLLQELIDDKRQEPLVTPLTRPEAGAGTVAMEAPRGLLIHSYVVDEWGVVVSADVVTPTAINQKAMGEQILADLADEKNQQRLKTTSERIIRSYDPCISCAVHILER